jgi:hypothetical protein
VFALANVSDEQLERVIVAPHFRLVNSKLFWPDLGSQRIMRSRRAKALRSTASRATRRTCSASRSTRARSSPSSPNLATPELPQIYLWEPDAYKDTVNAFTLYRGIVLGIAGLLAVFLTILFVVKGTSMLPATAALAWAVLAYICVDFGFLGKLIRSPGGPANMARGQEVALAASFVIFLFTYLNLNRWHQHLKLRDACLGPRPWPAVRRRHLRSGHRRRYRPPLLRADRTAGLVLIAYLGFNRYDRAILLVPAWALILVWLFGAWLTITGQLDNDIIQPALGGGLVLIVLLIGFTVMQHAFAGGAYSRDCFPTWSASRWR